MRKKLPMRRIPFNLCGKIGSASTSPGIGSSHPTISKKGDEGLEARLQIERFREVEFFCREMARTIGREEPKDRWQGSEGAGRRVEVSLNGEDGG